MFKSIITFCAVILSALGMSSTQANASSLAKDGLVVKVGDVIVQQGKSGWSAIKILAIDPWPDGTAAAHCLTYQPIAVKPTIESLKQAPVLAWHAPINAGSFGQGWERIGNQAPIKEELVGFVEYLKLTDFPRYIAFTGQDSKVIVQKANEHYKRAYALGDQGKRVEAITEYSQAIELFPLFYEAIDNRAFTYMELGKFREALSDFERSLRVNPTGMAAFFSKGECLMKLGQLKAAEAVFQEGQSRFPEQQATFEKFLKQVRALQKNG
ncbi:tetratricopeptide repeat protein [Acidovorax sp.]|uniref:tetratricopeptide repeat protein n=1 Tax=Acidovorax sp. TaxID=1872122 RepID=UPI00261C4507|nr:tetratricopeptide repeat protein [Acidovorax sp.]